MASASKCDLCSYWKRAQLLPCGQHWRCDALECKGKVSQHVCGPAIQAANAPSAASPLTGKTVTVGPAPLLAPAPEAVRSEKLRKSIPVEAAVSYQKVQLEWFSEVVYHAAPETFSAILEKGNGKVFVNDTLPPDASQGIYPFELVAKHPDGHIVQIPMVWQKTGGSFFSGDGDLHVGSIDAESGRFIPHPSYYGDSFLVMQVATNTKQPAVTVESLRKKMGPQLLQIASEVLNYKRLASKSPASTPSPHQPSAPAAESKRAPAAAAQKTVTLPTGVSSLERADKGLEAQGPYDSFKAFAAGYGAAAKKE